MSEVHEVILTSPFGVPDGPVADGLRACGFSPVGEHHSGAMVWYADTKLHFYASMYADLLPEDAREHGLWGIDGLRRIVLALPWRHESVPVHLQVLWWSDLTTTGDDGWAGRTGPYEWTHETWEIPAR